MILVLRIASSHADSSWTWTYVQSSSNCHQNQQPLMWRASQYPNVRKISLKAAAELRGKNSPCSNHLLPCPLCPPKSFAIWKYNLWSHILSTHPTANVELYNHLFILDPEEVTLMKAQYLSVPQHSKTSHAIDLATSDGHSSRMALRYDSSQYELISIWILQWKLTVFFI